MYFFPVSFILFTLLLLFVGCSFFSFSFWLVILILVFFLLLFFCCFFWLVFVFAFFLGFFFFSFWLYHIFYQNYCDTFVRKKTIKLFTEDNLSTLCKAEENNLKYQLLLFLLFLFLMLFIELSFATITASRKSTIFSLFKNNPKQKAANNSS